VLLVVGDRLLDDPGKVLQVVVWVVVVRRWAGRAAVAGPREGGRNLP
jgi:hypothetical protein